MTGPMRLPALFVTIVTLLRQVLGEVPPDVIAGMWKGHTQLRLLKGFKARAWPKAELLCDSVCSRGVRDATVWLLQHATRALRFAQRAFRSRELLAVHGRSACSANTAGYLGNESLPPVIASMTVQMCSAADLGPALGTMLTRLFPHIFRVRWKLRDHCSEFSASSAQTSGRS